jgi:hypothetical protein
MVLTLQHHGNTSSIPESRLFKVEVSKVRSLKHHTPYHDFSTSYLNINSLIAWYQTPEYHVSISLIPWHQISKMSHTLQHIIPWLQHLASWYWLFSKSQILRYNDTKSCTPQFYPFNSKSVSSITLQFWHLILHLSVSPNSAPCVNAKLVSVKSRNAVPIVHVLHLGD